MISENELAWAAGFVDGDGTINITRSQGKFFHLLIGAVNTHRPSVERLSTMFGGKVCLCSGGRHTWILHGRKAKEVIQMLEPFLFTKREHARIALAMPLAPIGGNIRRFGILGRLGQIASYMQIQKAIHPSRGGM